MLLWNGDVIGEEGKRLIVAFLHFLEIRKKNFGKREGIFPTLYLTNEIRKRIMSVGQFALHSFYVIRGGMCYVGDF